MHPSVYNTGYNDQLRLRDEVLDAHVNFNLPPDQVCTQPGPGLACTLVYVCITLVMCACAFGCLRNTDVSVCGWVCVYVCSA